LDLSHLLNDEADRIGIAPPSSLIRRECVAINGCNGAIASDAETVVGDFTEGASWMMESAEQQINLQSPTLIATAAEGNQWREFGRLALLGDLMGAAETLSSYVPPGDCFSGIRPPSPPPCLTSSPCSEFGQVNCPDMNLMASGHMFLQMEPIVSPHLRRLSCMTPDFGSLVVPQLQILNPRP